MSPTRFASSAEDSPLAAFLSVLSSLLVGLVLSVIPWTSFWDANYLLEAQPLLRGVFLNGFTRGAVSGLGLVNILLALIEARDHVRDGGP